MNAKAKRADTRQSRGGTLADRAMLIRLTIKQWTARKVDRAVTQEIIQSRGAAPDAGNFNKALIARAALDRIRGLISEIRHWHYDNTLPWTDDGARLLPAAHFPTYSAQLRKYLTAWEDAVGDFVARYPGFVEDSKRRLNGMFNADEYPAPAEIRRRFDLDVAIDPVHTSGDWRVELDDQQTSRIKRQIERRLEQATREAISDLWQRLHRVVRHIADRLSSPEAIFRDSLIGNARELCGLLTTLNVTNDPELEKARQAVEKTLARREPAELRENPEERKDAARQAQQIASQMDSYMRRKEAES